jgi:hypothetical protein
MRRPGGSNNTMEYRMDYVVSFNSNIFIFIICVSVTSLT